MCCEGPDLQSKSAAPAAWFHRMWAGEQQNLGLPIFCSRQMTERLMCEAGRNPKKTKQTSVVKAGSPRYPCPLYVFFRLPGEGGVLRFSKYLIQLDQHQSPLQVFQTRSPTAGFMLAQFPAAQEQEHFVSRRWIFPEVARPIS